MYNNNRADLMRLRLYSMQAKTYFCLSLHFHAVLDHHEEEVSLFYICFSSFIAVGLFIMTVAVIVTTIRSKAKGVFTNSLLIYSRNEYHERSDDHSLKLKICTQCAERK